MFIFCFSGSSQDSIVSLQLRLDETQNVVRTESDHGSDPASLSLLQSNNFSKLSSQTSSTPQPATKLAEKLKTSDRENVKMDKSSVHKLNLDDSVIIEDTPEKKSISIIDISDSSRDDINLLDNSQREPDKSSSSVKEILSSSMSEILGQNNLLYQECDNIDKVIDNDEDVQSMKYTDCLMDYDNDNSKEEDMRSVLYIFSEKHSWSSRSRTKLC